MKVLIADDNREFAHSVEKYLTQDPDFEIIGVTYSGEETLSKILTMKPDVVILDVIMPELDGVGIMSKLVESELTKMPIIIVESAVSQDYMAKRAMELGASCFMLKPFDMAILARRMKALYEKEGKSAISSSAKKIPYINIPRTNTPLDAEVEVTNLIHSIGIPPNISGHNYLREAVLMVMEDRGLITGITKELYPNVAKKCKTSATRVERAIRHAIEVSWNKAQDNTYTETFGYFVNVKRGRPTNGEFIAMIADRARLLLKEPALR